MDGAENFLEGVEKVGYRGVGFSIRAPSYFNGYAYHTNNFATTGLRVIENHLQH